MDFQPFILSYPCLLGGDGLEVLFPSLLVCGPMGDVAPFAGLL